MSSRVAVDVSIAAESRLVLVRHARSSHVQSGWLSAAGFQAWRAEYEAAGIAEEAFVPEQLQMLAGRADMVLSSDARRAVATARRLAPERRIVVSPLLGELALESPELGAIRLPLAGWALAVGARALLLRARRQYPSRREAARVEEAARWLGELALQHSTIVAVTHASFRSQLSERLVATGWHAESHRRSLKHWSAWSFCRAG